MPNTFERVLSSWKNEIGEKKISKYLEEVLDIRVSGALNFCYKLLKAITWYLIIIDYILWYLYIQMQSQPKLNLCTYDII